MRCAEVESIVPGDVAMSGGEIVLGTCVPWFVISQVGLRGHSMLNFLKRAALSQWSGSSDSRCNVITGASSE